MPLVSTMSLSSGVGGKCDGCGGDPLTLSHTIITYLLVISPNSFAQVGTCIVSIPMPKNKISCHFALTM